MGLGGTHPCYKTCVPQVKMVFANVIGKKTKEMNQDSVVLCSNSPDVDSCFKDGRSDFSTCTEI